MKKFLLPVIFSLIMIPLSCGTDPGDFMTTVSGKVVDQETQRPLDSVSLILINGESTHNVGFSDSTGYYFFGDFGYGPFTIMFHKQYYISESITIQGSKWQLDFPDVTIELVPSTTTTVGSTRE